VLEFTTIVPTICFVNSNSRSHTDHTVIVSLTTVYDLSRIEPPVSSCLYNRLRGNDCAWARPAVCAAEQRKRMLASGLPITRAPGEIAYDW